jgi:cytidine deaminase
MTGTDRSTDLSIGRSHALSTADQARLIAAALTARGRAYAPYSGFAVGAAVLAGDTIFAGCNVENASYGLTICAERVAIFTAIAAGAQRITAIAVVTDTPAPTFPCGACRQVLAECNGPLVVICATVAGAIARRLLSDLLPDAFGAAALPDRVQ